MCAVSVSPALARYQYTGDDGVNVSSNQGATELWMENGTVNRQLLQPSNIYRSTYSQMKMKYHYYYLDHVHIFLKWSQSCIM